MLREQRLVAHCSFRTIHIEIFILVDFFLISIKKNSALTITRGKIDRFRRPLTPLSCSVHWSLWSYHSVYKKSLPKAILSQSIHCYFKVKFSISYFLRLLLDNGKHILPEILSFRERCAQRMWSQIKMRGQANKDPKVGQKIFWDTKRIFELIK